jgi:hypothetical protein
VERQLFAGAGAEVFLSMLRSRVLNSFKMFQKPKIFRTKIKILFLFTLKNLLLIIYVFKKHEKFLKPFKFEFFLIIWGKWSEPEPEFLTSLSRSRTIMDRLRNTDKYGTGNNYRYALLL